MWVQNSGQRLDSPLFQCQGFCLRSRADEIELTGSVGASILTTAEAQSKTQRTAVVRRTYVNRIGRYSTMRAPRMGDRG